MATWHARVMVGLAMSWCTAMPGALPNGFAQSSPAPSAGESAVTALERAAQLQEEADRQIAARAFAEATEKTERALDIRRQHLGAAHPDVAYSISRLGLIAYYQGQYDRAEMLLGEALAIREATLGRDHLDVAQSLNDLASMWLVKGDYVRPEPLFQRALAIYRRALSQGRASEPQRDVTALMTELLSNLALLHHRRGDYVRAESEYLEVLKIRVRTRGPDDPAVALTMANLGAVYYASARYAKAVQVLRDAIRIQEKRVPANDPSLATPNFNLAAVYFDQGDYAAAETGFRRALDIDERTLNPEHPRIAVRLLGLAEALRLEGEYGRADPLYERALAIRERALGPTHPLVAEALIAHALLRYATGDVEAAVNLLARGSDVRDDTMAHVLTTGSEDGKRLYLRTLRDETDIAISMHLGSAQRSPGAARLAAMNVMQRKGRALETMADHMATLRQRLNDGDRQVLTQLSEAQTRLASLVLRGVGTDGERQTVAALRSDVQRLEQAISIRSSEFNSPSPLVLRDVEEALPAEAALIEFVAYRPFAVRNPRNTAFGAPHYAAYVVRKGGVIAGVDLGATVSVDRIVQRFRRAVSNPADQRVREAAHALYDTVMAPLQSSLTGVEQLVLSPDGALNLVPFAALVDRDDSYLVQRFTMSYVTSGRDLVRMREFRPEGVPTPAVIVANPLFGVVSRASNRPVAQSPPRGFTPATAAQVLEFSALPGTAQEAAAVAAELPGARIYTGANATEAVVKHLSGPTILHIATHGFFLKPAGDAAAVRELALVSSAIALAGANQRRSGDGEDGILTALEVAGLDLWGTRMVVLSACDTGVGDASNGEGVYGLRRALVLAGSESQVMSLWEVSDNATKDLMTAYYQRLRAGGGRAGALRDVQLSFLRRNQPTSHPFYWASFIESGDWGPIRPVQ